MRALILASTSPYRRRILEDAGLTVRCVAPGVDESVVDHGVTAVRTRALAAMKALAVPAGPGDIVIGADQLLEDPRTGEIFGKPADDAAHLARLRSLRGRDHVLVTGFCVRVVSAGPDGPVTSRQIVGDEVTRLWFRADTTDEELHAYVACGEARGCAGGYAAEGRGAFLIERIEGDWTNVIGLPIFRILDALRSIGWRFHG